MKKPITTIIAVPGIFCTAVLCIFLTASPASAQSSAPSGAPGSLPVTLAQSIKGDFALKNVHTGKYVRIKDANGANGTPIVAYPPVNWKCVTWQFQPAASGGGYTLKNLFSGKTLQPINGQAAAGVALEEQPMRRAGNNQGQEYELIAALPDQASNASAGSNASNAKAAKNAQYYIRLKGSDLYLTPSDAGGEENSSIILRAKQDGDLQRWTLIEQHPTM